MNNDIHMYRVWDKLDKRYVRHLLLGVDGLLYEIIDGKAVSVDQDRYEREQCTGERDRSRKLIYKGDIVNALLGPNVIAMAVVKRHPIHGAWQLDDGKPGLVFVSDAHDRMVVGNIHEVKHE